MNMQKNAKSDKKTRYIDPEPGDEKLSPMELEWKYHVPFEGTLFPLRPDPDPEKLREMRERNAMVGTDAKPSIFRGVDTIINKLLELHGQRARGKDLTFADILGAKKLVKSPRDALGDTLVSEIYNQIQSNCFDAKNQPRPSPKLWVLRTMTTLSPKHLGRKAKEVPLERRAVEIFELCKVLAIGRLTDVSWYNQIPTASGLVSSASEGRNAVDLVCRRQKGIYDLIELKSHADNPLYAAIEILKHGVLYLFFVSNLKRLNVRPQGTGLPTGVDARELIEAKEIALCVLAPKEFYNGYSLRWIEDELNRGLQSFLRDSSRRFLPKMQFRFEWYPDPPFVPTEEGGFIFSFTRKRYDWNPSKQSAD
jgi:hypothetical protein